MSFNPRRPDWRLVATNKVPKERSVIGAAWNNADTNTVSIKLGPCVLIDSADSEAYFLTLIPTED